MGEEHEKLHVASAKTAIVNNNMTALRDLRRALVKEHSEAYWSRILKAAKTEAGV